MTPGTGLFVSHDQLRPDDVLMMDASSLGSMPRRTPRFMVSAVPTMVMPRSMLLQILTT